MDSFFPVGYTFFMIDESLVRDCGPMVTALCRRMLRNPELAADTEQDIWEKVIRKAGTFRGESRLTTWIYSVARNEILKVLEYDGKRDWLSLTEEYHSGEFRPGDDAVSLKGQTSQYCDACLTGMLAVLTPSDRLIYLFRYVVGLSYAVISGIMEMDESAVRQRASRASRKLRRFLSEECAFLVPGSICRCGMARYMKNAGLDKEFFRLRRVSERASVFREAESVFPRSGYWLKLLGS